MTTDEFIAKQDAKIKAIIRENKPLEIAVKSAMAIQAKRIFLDGKNAEGVIIGEYSDNEIYVSPNANKGLPNFPLNGKPDSEGKTSDTKKTVYDINTKVKKRINVKSGGGDRKTGYFKNYLAFKKTLGRNKRIQTVDLFLTGSLLRNWANAEALVKAQAKKISQNKYVVALTDLNFKKAERYGNVFGLSKTEKDTFLKVIQFEFNKAMK
jgi:hypothetical protein